MSAEASLVSHVVPNQSSFFPGEAFRGTWEVAYPAVPAAQSAICVRDIRIDVTGTEHVDPKWVSSSYHGSEAVVYTSARRIARHIFCSHGVPEAPQMILNPGELRRASIRCLLPRQLPPTFHGSAVRFSYSVVVTYRAEFLSAASTDALGASVPAPVHCSSPTAAAARIEALDLSNDADTKETLTSDLLTQPQADGGTLRAAQNLGHPAELQQRVTTASAEHPVADTSVGACDNDAVAAAADVAAKASSVDVAVGAPWATRSGELTDDISVPLSGGSPPAELPVPAPTSPATPATPAQLVASAASPSRATGAQPKAAAQPAAKTTLHATFKIAIAPPDTLPTVPEFDVDGEADTPRAVGGGVGSGPLKSLSTHSMLSIGPVGLSDPVNGPMIDFWMLSSDETAPVEVEVFPTLPIGAERHMWGTGPAAAGRFFLWAPNEVDEAGGGPPSALSARGGAPHRVQSTTDVTNATSADGDSVKDAGDLCSHSESGFGASVIAPSVQSASPRASRLSGALSEAGTPRVAPARERSLPPDLRAFSLSFQGCPLACVELHTPADSPLQPGMTFSGTVDFRATSAPGSKRVACRQVSLLLESEEHVARGWLRPGRLTAAASSAPPVTRRLYHESQDVTCDALFTSFMFTVPPDAPPAFRTPLVALRWFLRFELSVVAVAPVKGGAVRRDVAGSSGGALSVGKWEGRAEQLVWRMPLPVVAAGGKGFRSG